MRSCKEITKLVSQSLDGPLPWRTRLAVWMHLKMCKLCSAFRRDQNALRRRLIEAEQQPTMAANVRLSAEAKQRLQKQIDSRLS